MVILGSGLVLCLESCAEDVCSLSNRWSDIYLKLSSLVITSKILKVIIPERITTTSGITRVMGTRKSSVKHLTRLAVARSNETANDAMGETKRFVKCCDRRGEVVRRASIGRK